MRFQFGWLKTSVSDSAGRRRLHWYVGSVLLLLGSIGYRGDVIAQSDKGNVAQCCVTMCRQFAAGSGRDLGMCIRDCQRATAGTDGGDIRAICEALE